MALNIEYAKRHVQCNCGHYAKSHFAKEGQCSKCGCTWYWPNDRWLKKHKENGMELNKIIALRMHQSLLPEALERVEDLKVHNGDRVRMVFEFEIKQLPTKKKDAIVVDAVEVRHRRPWK